MKIELNTALEPTPLRTVDADRLINTLKWKLGRDHDHNLLRYTQADEAIQHESFLYMASAAYSAHHAVKINPHDLWYIVLCEIAATINANSDAFRHLFTTSSEKKAIMVPTGDVTHLPLDAVIVQLRDLVPGDVDQFIPEFSTHTKASRTACYAAFADAVKSYYSYMTFCCGLPAIEIGGTAEDWDLFGMNLTGIAMTLKPVLDALTPPNAIDRRRDDNPAHYVTSEYFARVLDRIEMICALFDGGPTDFVQDFYSHRNVGSGGEKDVTGWIKDFYVNPTSRLDNFNPCMSIVPYSNMETGRQFNAIFGAFSSKVEDGFLTADYGHAVFEQVAKADAKQNDKVGSSTHFEVEKVIVHTQPEALEGWTFEVADTIECTVGDAAQAEIEKALGLEILKDR